VDEAGRMTKPPHIMAPSGLEADPVVEPADTIVDNGIMSSRTRTGSSRSGAARRADGTNGNSASSNGNRASETAATAAQDADDAAPAAVPLPAETVGQPKGSANGDSASRDSASRDGASRPAAGEAPARSPDQPPADSTQAAGSERASLFTPSTAPAAGSPYPGSGVPYQDQGRTYPATPQPSQASAWAPQPAPAAGNGSSPGSSAFSSVSEFSSGAASAVSGAAAGLASSVTSVFTKRGTKSDGQWRQGSAARKSAKRQAMLTLARVEPWSVMKFSFVASVVAFVILFVAVAVLYMVLSALGVFDSLQHTVSTVTSSQGSAGTNISHWFSASLILGYTAMLGALNIVLITAMSTVGSVIYNLIAKTIGGIEVTLRETE